MITFKINNIEVPPELFSEYYKFHPIYQIMFSKLLGAYLHSKI